MIGAEANRWDG